MKFISSKEVTEPGIYLCRHSKGNITLESVWLKSPGILRTGDSNSALEKYEWHGPLTETDAYDLYKMKGHDE